MVFSRAIFHKILSDAGAERVSDEAADALKEIIEDFAEDLAKKMVRVAEHANRKTVMASDVELVTSEES